MLELMILPFVVGVILTGIFAYFGIHIVEREVIFVDLALAQIAALGASFGILFGLEAHSALAYAISLIFTILGALIFAVTRMKEQDVPQEAIIGIVYVVAAAAAILVFNRVPEAAEHIRAMLVGNILFTTNSDVIRIFLVCVVVGAFHIIFRQRFLLISLEPEKAEQEDISIGWWDFLFYLSFGLAVVSAVRIAGILLVFSYLIVPAVCAMLLKQKFSTRLAIGWGLGALTSFFGLYFSVLFDWPTGASVVCTFGLALIIIAMAKQFLPQPK